jgi:hypothetical protein
VPEIHYVVPLPDTELFHKTVEMGIIKNPQEYIIELMGDLGKNIKSINLTKMSDDEMQETINRCNREIKRDFNRKHPIRYLLSFIGLDHLKPQLLFRKFSLRQVIPLMEAFAWVTVGKHMHLFRSKPMHLFRK